MAADVPPSHHLVNIESADPRVSPGIAKTTVPIDFKSTRTSRSYHPVIMEFQTLIETDPEVYMLFTNMFREIPTEPPYDKDPSGHDQPRDYKSMLDVLNEIIYRAPPFCDSSMVGFQINSILAWIMGTPSGILAFTNDKVNGRLKNLLDTYARFLSSPESTSTLTEDAECGWLGSKAMEQMPKFLETFECNPKEPHYGFSSWDDFFTRRLRHGVRPIEDRHDHGVITNACESTPYRLAYNVSARDHFWIKSQPYSLNDMLAQDVCAPKFHGGTVYQAYLGPMDYHRWHSPVSGSIVKTRMQPGTYFSQIEAEGFDPWTPNGSQAYLTAVATRAMIFIEADNADIGLMCFMPVGITEVSSCVITVSAGQHVDKGDELGSFHYGGSTYCLIFRPQTKLLFQKTAHSLGPEAKVIPVNSALAFVQPP